MAMDSSTVFVLTSIEAIDSLGVFVLEFATKYLTRKEELRFFSDFFFIGDEIFYTFFLSSSYAGNGKNQLNTT